MSISSITFFTIFSQYSVQFCIFTEIPEETEPIKPKIEIPKLEDLFPSVEDFTAEIPDCLKSDFLDNIRKFSQQYYDRRAEEDIAQFYKQFPLFPAFIPAQKDKRRRPGKLR